MRHWRKTAVAAAAMIVAAPALARPMTAEDVIRLEQVGDVAVAPDGRLVAYTVQSLPDIAEGEKNGATRSRLWVAAGPDQARRFLPDDMDVSQVRFTPDGRWISFLWKPEGEGAVRGLYAIPVDGGGHRKLVALEEDIRDYAWGPDSRTVYLVAAPPEIEEIEQQEERGFDAIVYEEEFGFNRLFAADVWAGEAAPGPRAIEVEGYVTDVEVFPDGRRLLIASAPTPLIDQDYTSKRLRVLDAATGRVTAVIETPGKIGDYEIAPGGEAIALVAAVDENDPAPSTLFLADAATGAFRAVNAGAREAVVDVEWTADGRLAAIVHVGVDGIVRFYAPDGSTFDTVDPGAAIPREIDAGGGRIALVADAPTHPTELHALDEGQLRRWTRLNPWLAEIDLGEHRVFTYAARDGTEVERVVILPVGGVPAGGAPTILTVHGGPEAHYSNGWLTGYSTPGQVAAGDGYAVFYPNYRGSTGYGVAFSKLHQADYAGGEFDDLVDGIQALDREGIVDADRVGITGGSYGGYASAWGATALSEHFAASVMFVGVSDLLSKFGTTDIPQEMYLVHARKWPWDDWMDHLRRSPIYHAGNSRTPTLILHGLEDTRVSPSQSYELYRHLKIRGQAPVRLVLYPGEGHGNRNAAARYDYLKRLMRWMNQYVVGPDGPPPPPRVELPPGFLGAAESEVAD